MKSSTSYGRDRIVAVVIVMTIIVVLGMYLSDSWEFPFP